MSACNITLNTTIYIKNKSIIYSYDRAYVIQKLKF